MIYKIDGIRIIYLKAIQNGPGLSFANTVATYIQDKNMHIIVYRHRRCLAKQPN